MRAALEVRRWGPIAGPVRTAAVRDGEGVALVDEWGALTFAELDRHSNALARYWSELGLGPRSVVAVLCRNRRGLVEALLAAGKLGARVVLMNIGFGRTQLAGVAARESISALVFDEEFQEVLAAVPHDVARFVTAGEGGPAPFAEVFARWGTESLAPPARTGGLILLTSGTSGTPKGAPRQANSAVRIVGFLDRIPLRVGESTYIAAPMFHGTGLMHFILAMALGSTVVTARRFTPKAALHAMSEHRCTAAITIPTMVQRMLAVEPETRAAHDLSALRILWSMPVRTRPTA